MTEKITLIGCGMFQEDALRILAEEGLDLELDWLEVGLHDNIERLEETLDQALAGRGGGVGLLYGHGCIPEMKAFARERGVAVLSAKNCLAALVGDAELKELEQNRTLVATPGWVRKMWLGRVDTAAGWTADDYRIQFGRYDLILVLDPGLEPLTDEEIITCYDLVQVPIETRPVSLDHFRRVFLELVGAARENAKNH